MTELSDIPIRERSRQRYSVEYKPRLVEETLQNNTSAASVVLTHPINANLLLRLRREYAVYRMLTNHQPIYSRCQQAAREGVQLSESTIGDVIGATHQLLRPLVAALRRYVFAAEKLHGDDTPIAVLAPGTGKTWQARLWVYTRDDRPADKPESASRLVRLLT